MRASLSAADPKSHRTPYLGAAAPLSAVREFSPEEPIQREGVRGPPEQLHPLRQAAHLPCCLRNTPAPLSHPHTIASQPTLSVAGVRHTPLCQWRPASCNTGNGVELQHIGECETKLTRCLCGVPWATCVAVAAAADADITGGQEHARDCI